MLIGWNGVFCLFRNAWRNSLFCLLKFQFGWKKGSYDEISAFRRYDDINRGYLWHFFLGWLEPSTRKFGKMTSEHIREAQSYTPGSTNIAGWKMGAPDWFPYFLLKIGISQPAMLVYQRVEWIVNHQHESWESKGTPPMPPPPKKNKALLRDY